jgi:hypothetical protein
MSADERRKRSLAALREMYIDAEKDAKEKPREEQPLDVGPFRRGVLEGIRRAAFKLFGVIDVDVVTKGLPYIGNEGHVNLDGGVFLTANEVAAIGALFHDRAQDISDSLGSSTRALLVRLRILSREE